MKFEKSVGAVIFRKEENEILYLLLHYPGVQGSDYWDLVKGHVEEKELEKETIVREAFEETGIKDLEFIEGFKEKVSYIFKRNIEDISKEVIFYLAETKTKDILISFEHTEFKWASFSEATPIMKFREGKSVLTKANEFLKRK
jgi:8-oxo-dGTP pyrophosphatase MutT (NUDIX family)